MNTTYFLIGGNVGDKLDNIKKAKNLIQLNIGNIINQSSIYKTAAWGINNQPDFLNQVLIVETKFSGENCMEKIFSIEEEMGRIRTIKNAARIIDIDILFFNNDIIKQKNLVVPHPEIKNRKFVLIPMNELSPQFIHPVLKCSINDLLTECKDRLEVNLYKER